LLTLTLKVSKMLTLTLLTLVKLRKANSAFLELVKTKRSNSNLKVQLFTVSAVDVEGYDMNVLLGGMNHALS
jgi:hypothetical protein